MTTLRPEMTGPEPYRQAEQHLIWAIENAAGTAEERYNLAAAQAHATLAQTAATAEAGGLTDASNTTSGTTPWARVLNGGAA